LRRGALFDAGDARVFSGGHAEDIRSAAVSFEWPSEPEGPGLEANTGPLGHGLPIGVGAAIAAKLAKASWRVFVVLGDSELQEGSNWEAAMCAGHRRLDNLRAIVDRNRLQQGARTEETNPLEPLADR
jgi:transketolase